MAGVADNPLEQAIRAPDTQLSQDSSRSNSGYDEDIFSFIWIAILAGFAALLTPCVFPMIPLTVSYFAKQEESKRGVGNAIIFGLAIVVTFTLIGIVLAALVGVSGAQNFASNPFVNFFYRRGTYRFCFEFTGHVRITITLPTHQFLKQEK